jgi:hypothetical protein
MMPGTRPEANSGATTSSIDATAVTSARQRRRSQRRQDLMSI